MDKKNGHLLKAYARMRPILKTEPKSNIIDHTISPKEIILKSRFTEKKFNLDQVFSSESTQQDVYNTIVSPMIPQIIGGYSWTVLGYGQTGTGKTHTIFGENPHMINHKCDEVSTAGLISLSSEHLFSELSKLDLKTQFTVQVSFFEVINEEVHDLLADYAALRIYDDPLSKGSVGIKDISKLTVLNTKYLNEWLTIGLNERKKSHGKLNFDSSCGHLFFRILVTVRTVNSRGEESIKSGRLQFVDTANSEVGNRPSGRESTAHRSSITLARVIKALNQKVQFVPFRDSKLTRILQDSFGGNTKTAMLATFSINSCDWEETINTLECAVAAKTIINYPQINLLKKQADILTEIENEIEKNTSELAAARRGVGFYISLEKYEQMTGERENRNKEVSESLRQIEKLEHIISERKNQHSTLTQLFKDNKVDLEEKKSLLERELVISKETEAQLNNLSQNYSKTLGKNNILKEVCESSTKNVDVFHDKYREKSQAFMGNANAARDVANTVRATYKDIINSNKCCSQQVTENLDEMKKTWQFINHNHLQNLNRITDLAGEVSEIGKNHVLDFHDYGKTEAESVISIIYHNNLEKLDHLNEIKNDCMGLKNVLAEKRNLWKKQGEELMQNWNEAMTHIESQQNKNRKKILEYQQDLARRKEVCLRRIQIEEENLLSLEKMYELNSQEEQEIEEEYRSIERAREMIADLESHSNQIPQTVVQYQPEFDKHIQNANEMIEEVTSQLTEIGNNLEVTRNTITSTHKEGQEEINNLATELSENFNTIIEKHVNELKSVAISLEKPVSDLEVLNLGLEACNSAEENLQNILEARTQRYFNVNGLIARTIDVVSKVYKNINSVGHAGDTPARRRWNLSKFLFKKHLTNDHNGSDKEN